MATWGLAPEAQKSKIVSLYTTQHLHTQAIGVAIRSTLMLSIIPKEAGQQKLYSYHLLPRFLDTKN